MHTLPDASRSGLAARGLIAAAAALILFLVSVPTPLHAEQPKKPEPHKKTEVYKVPYQLSETQHIVVRAKINGKGPFNFVVDTGAPALILGTEPAKKLGIEADKNGWGICEKFVIEGGIELEKVKARIEDPFQLIGMNKMNLPGMRYDGLMGYTVLARFKIAYDFTQPHLTWTQLDWEPPPPAGLAELGGKPPRELDMMGTLVSLAAALIGRQPDPEIISRGFLGIELVDGATDVFIVKVLENSPAEKAGLQAMDRLKKFQGKAAESVENLQKLAREHAAAAEIEIEVERDGQRITVSFKARKGL